MEMHHEIIKKATMPDGTDIQIEDWSTIYSCYTKNGTLAAYPISKWNCVGDFAPKIGKKFRAEFEFHNEKECKKAFDNLISGNASLLDYIDKYEVNGVHSKEEKEDYYKCLGLIE